MTIDEVKNELSHMEAPVLKELTSFILQLRRSLEPERKENYPSSSTPTPEFRLNLPLKQLL